MKRATIALLLLAACRQPEPAPDVAGEVVYEVVSKGTTRMIDHRTGIACYRQHGVTGHACATMREEDVLAYRRSLEGGSGGSHPGQTYGSESGTSGHSAP